MKTILLTILAVISTLSARGEPTGQNVQELLRTIRSKLPEGWTASYQKQYSLLEISRRKPVWGRYPEAQNGNGDLHKTVRGKVSFSFRITEAVSPMEYKRMSAENAALSKQLKALDDELTKRKIPRKNDSFSPRTDPETQLVARYNALEKSFHHLPEFYFHDICLDREGFPGRSLIDFVPEEDLVYEECSRLRETLIKLLSKYE